MSLCFCWTADNTHSSAAKNAQLVIQLPVPLVGHSENVIAEIFIRGIAAPVKWEVIMNDCCDGLLDGEQLELEVVVGAEKSPRHYRRQVVENGVKVGKEAIGNDQLWTLAPHHRRDGRLQCNLAEGSRQPPVVYHWLHCRRWILQVVKTL